MLTRLTAHLAASAVFCALSSPTAWATTVEQQSLRKMATEALSIVHGTVVSTSSRWTDDRSLIVTDVLFQVHEVLKGPEVSDVVVTQPGGVVGGIRVDADGAVAHRPGEEAILFLKQSPRGHTYVMGLFQGRFDVVKDARGNKMVRGLSPEYVNVIRSGPSGGTEDAFRTSRLGGVPLDAFLGGVRDLVKDAVKDGGR